MIEHLFLSAVSTQNPDLTLDDHPCPTQADASRTNARRHTRPTPRAHARPAHPRGGSAPIILDPNRRGHGLVEAFTTIPHR